MKVLFVCNFEAPYRVEFWNELSQYCDVTVLFSETKEQQQRDSKWFARADYRFHYEMLKQTKVGRRLHICFGVTDYLKRDFDIIVFHPYSPPTCIWGILYCIVHKIPYVINSDGGFAKTGRGLTEKIKSFLISHAEGYLSTAAATDDYLCFYGGHKKYMYRYSLTTLRKSDMHTSPITQGEKDRLRKKLGINEKNMIISVGNMIPRKGFDLLLKACREIQPGVGVYIVGGKPTKDYIDYCVRYKLSNVHFLEFMDKSTLSQYYMAADIFVLPTREDIWGLVVIEAMASRLPVVTTNMCIAGKEFIKHGENGFIYDVEDVRALAGIMNRFFSEQDLKQIMSLKAYESVKNCTIETMALRHITIFQEMIELRRRAG